MAALPSRRPRRRATVIAPKLTPENFKAAFTTSEGWGSYSQQVTKGEFRAEIAVKWGRLRLNTLTLAEHDGKTTLTLRGGPHNATEAERKTFEDAHNSVRQGFAGTLDQLADYLARA